MSLRTSHLAGAVAALILAISPMAAAQTPNPQAEALNDEGKVLYRNQDYAAAVAKFNDAIAMSPEARYYFNLCASYEKMNDFDRALEACDAVYAHNPKDDLKAKTGQRAAEIRQKKRDAGGTTGGGTTGGGTTGGGTTGGGTTGGGTTGGGTTGGGTTGGGTTGGGTTGGGTTGGGTGGGTTGGGGAPPPPYGYGAGAPAATVEKEADPREKYRWSLGVDIGPTFNRGMGNEGDFGDSGTVVRFHADFLIAPRWKIGLQVYAGGQSFSPGESLGDKLAIGDFGGGLFWHRRLTKSLFLTPLVGAQLSTLQPNQDFNDAYATFGFRIDVGLTWVFGSGRHVISVTPTFNRYLPAAATAQGFDPSIYGLDHGGTTLALTFGYTYRFAKGFLPSVIVLE